MKRNLTDAAVKNATLKNDGKPNKLTDGGGLFLLINRAGKYWRYSYRFAGKQKTLAIGVYPEIGLKDARIRHEEARERLAKGVDPSEYKRREKLQAKTDSENTFQSVSDEWFIRESAGWSQTYIASVDRILKKDINPFIGTRPIADIEPPEVLSVLRRMEKRVGDTTRRAQQISSQVFRYGVQTGKCKRDVTADLKGAIKRKPKKHFAAIIDPKGVGELLRAIEGYQGEYSTLCALRFSPLVFVRPFNIRAAEWVEFDLDAALWTIPAAKLKLSTEKKRENLPKDAETVPLSKQAVKVLRDIEPLTGHWRYVFPSIRSKQRPMSENTVNAALRRMGFDSDTMTAHGFRAMASSQLNELGYRPDVIEAALFHKDGSVRGVYNRTKYFSERQEMMQAWADYLDGLRDGAEVIPINRKRA